MTDQDAPTGDLRPPQAAGERKRRRRLRVAAFLIGVLLVGLLALAGRLLGEPVWSESAAGLVAARLGPAIGEGAVADVGVAGFSLDGLFRPVIHLRDVVLRVPGTGSVSIDTMSVASRWSDLGTSADRVVADHLVLALDTPDVAPATPLPPLPDLVAALDRLLAAPRIRYLEVGAFTLFRGTAAGGRVEAMREVAATAEAGEGGGLSVRLAGSGRTGSFSLAADVTPGDGGARTVNLETRGLDVADLTTAAGQGDPLATGPVGFTGSVRIVDGVVADGGGQLSIGPIAVAGGATSPLEGGRGRLQVSVRPGGRTIVVIPSPLVLGGGQVLVGGEIDVPDGGSGPWPFRLAVSARGTDGGDTRRGLANVTGSYDPAEQLLAVDTIRAAGEGARFDAAIRLSHADGHVAGALSGAFATMSVDVLKAIWPSIAVADARGWVIDHVESGTISDATVDLTVFDSGLGQLASERAAAEVSFRFDGLAFRSFDGGPMIRDAAGSARLAGGRFVVDLASGRVDLGVDGSLAIAPGRFVIPDVAIEPPTGEIAITLTGAARATLALWKRLPLAGGTLSVDPAGTAGDVEATVDLSLPLVKDLDADSVTYNAAVRLSGLSLPEPVQGRRVTEGDVSIRVHDGVAEITGSARLDGVKADLDLVEPLDGDAASESAVRLRVGDEDRERLGIGLGKTLVGPVSVSVTSAPAGSPAGAQLVDADLTDARLRIPALGVDKAKGKPGTARFLLRTGGDRISVDDLRIEAEGLLVTGDLTLGPDGRLLAADLPRITARSGDRLSLKASRADDGVLEVEVRGSRFDARRMVRSQLRGGGASAGADAVRLDVAIDTVTGFGEEALTGFNLDAAVTGGLISGLALTAQTSGGGAASLTLLPAGGTRRLEVEAGEVGRILRFLGIYRRVYGGRAVVTGTVDAGGGIQASVDGSRLRIVEEPALARLSTAAETGSAAGIATVDIERLLFDLAFADGRLRISDGVVRAATAGLSLQGEIDFSRDTVRLAGTYLPASAFDSFLGKIPLIGQTMFAGGRAGLLGVTFRLAGAIDDPVLTVNPLSAIAPGIFRKLFELR